MRGQVVTLRTLVGRIDRLEVCCRHCERHGRLGVAGLIQQHGAALGLPELGTRLAADCARAASINPSERCFVWFPQLLQLGADLTGGPPPSKSVEDFHRAEKDRLK